MQRVEEKQIDYVKRLTGKLHALKYTISDTLAWRTDFVLEDKTP